MIRWQLLNTNGPSKKIISNQCGEPKPTIDRINISYINILKEYDAVKGHHNNSQIITCNDSIEMDILLVLLTI